MAILVVLRIKMLIASTCQVYGDYSGSDPCSHMRRQLPLFPPSVPVAQQQRHSPVLLPRLRHNGG